MTWSGDRKPDPKTGKLPSVGSTVDVANATWTNTVGAPELVPVWKDPSFDPAQRAFYYVRVIEIPTPRWTAYDAKRFGVKPLEGTAMKVVERAYTSPIWYTPKRCAVTCPARRIGGLVAAAAMLAAVPAAAETSDQFWPGLDAFFPLTDATRLYLMATGTSTELTLGQVGSAKRESFQVGAHRKPSATARACGVTDMP